jgi:hypothetical protein
VAVDRSQLSRDLNAKLRLEKRLFPKVRSAENALIKELVRSIGSGRGVPDLKETTKRELESELLAHYLLTASQFSSTIRGQLPKGAAMTSEEAELVDAEVQRYSEERAPAQVAIIAGTNQEQAIESASVAREEMRRLIAGGERSIGDRDEAMIAGAAFQRKLRGRTEAIAALETQAAAEAGKQIEVESLVRPGAHVTGRVVEKLKKVIKEWVTQGDSRVRNHHLKVDSTQVPANELFTVNGEKLMHPGDTSHGATASNIVNCRCSSVTDVAAIASARQA